MPVNEFFIAVIRDPSAIFSFSFVNRARDPLYDPLIWKVTYED